MDKKIIKKLNIFIYSDKNLLVEAIKRDTAFLAIHQMMDYSLLAGICRLVNSHGIILMLRMIIILRT